MSRNTILQMLQYGLIAIIGLVIDFGLLIFCTEILNLYYLIGVCAGFICGLIATYLLSNAFVFGKPKISHRKTFLLFAFIGIVGLGLLNLLVWIMTDLFQIYYLVSKCLATIVVFLWNFFARKSLYND